MKRLLLFLALSLAPVAAQTPDIVIVLKSRGYTQTSPTALSPDEAALVAIVNFPTPVALTTQVQMRTSTGAGIPLIRLTSDFFLGMYAFPDHAALDRAMPDGSYTLAVSGDGTPSTTPFTLSGGAFSQPSRISNFTALQSWSGTSVRVDWAPFEGGSPNDYVSLAIKRADGTSLYTSPSIFEPGALTGSSTTHTIDRLNIAAGETVYGTLSYYRITAATANANLTAVATGSGYAVEFPISRALPSKPVIVAQPESLTTAIGSTVALNVAATGDTLSYQWKKNGLPIAGATSSLYLLVNAQPTMSGSYTVDVTNLGGTTPSASASLNVLSTADTGGIRNLAIRSSAGTGSQTLIVGLAVGGAGTSGSKPLLIRGVGPALGAFGLSGFLSDPKLELYGSSSSKLDENDNWGGGSQISSTAAALGAFSLGPTTSRDAALLTSLAPGPYTAQISGVNNTTGIALAEIYDASTSFTTSTPRLINVAARAQVGTGGDILIAGFNIGGQTSRTVLIRAIGPTLGVFGVPGFLADPKLELFRGTAKIQENDNWGGSTTLSSAASSVGAFPISSSSKDSVLLVTLPPGSYTAQVSGVNNTTGVALVEVYEVP